ncbi:MAG: hypothetical protein NZL83_03580 [Candidatus Absconditabacterales bacterium]|nr:hypothetical protein [Candidatus Absconditabacterales bacterium]
MPMTNLNYDLIPGLCRGVLVRAELSDANIKNTVTDASPHLTLMVTL